MRGSVRTTAADAEGRPDWQTGPATGDGVDPPRPDSVPARLRAAVANLIAAQAELVALTREAAETEAWSGPGLRSLNHWLTWQAGVSPSTAAQLVRVAAADTTHPALTASFEHGELTLDQVAVAVTAPPEHDAQMAALSKLCTVGQIRTLVRAAAAASDDGSDPERSREFVRLSQDDDGTGHVRARLDADRYSIVEAAIAAARDRLVRGGAADVTTADAFLDVFERAFDAETATRRERFKPVIHLNPDEPVPARWRSGLAVPDAIRQYVMCDGWLTPSFTDGARPLSVGRSLRIVPERTRRDVLRRDRECRMTPWCHRTHGLEIHHIVHWEDGGPSDTWNLVAGCATCHRRHHRGEFHIAGNADDPKGLTFTDANGRVIHPPGPPPPATPRQHAPPNYEHPLGERLDTGQLFFDACPAPVVH